MKNLSQYRRIEVIQTDRPEVIIKVSARYLPQRGLKWAGDDILMGGIALYRYKVIEMRDIFLQCTAYGIVAEYGKGHTAVVPHLSCDKAFVSRLAARCDRGQVEPEHLLDVVTDALLF